MNDFSNRIVIPLIKTNFGSFESNSKKPFELWDNTVLTQLEIDDFPKEAQNVLDNFFKQGKPFAAFSITLNNTNTDTIDTAINEWKNQLKYFRFLYWVSCGNPTNPFFGLVINDNRLVRILDTPRGIDPDGYILKDFQSYGITHEFLVEYKETMTRLSSVDSALQKLTPCFELADAGFDSISVNLRLTLFIAAIESLLLPGVASEMTYQLALRTSLMASNTLEERKMLFRKFKKIYGLRSGYIHGELDDITKFKFEGEQLDTAYHLRKYLFPVFRNFFSSKELIEIRSDKNDSFRKWNDYFADMILA